MAFSDVKKFLLLAVLAAVVVALLWGVPPLLGEPDAYRRTLALILGGAGLLYGLYLTQRWIVATEDNLRVAQEGQVTDRFTRAIAQLGHTEMAIRVGGIYALAQLAKDSEKDHGPIMEVLTAYVRERAATPEAATPEAATPEAATPPPSDIQAILTVIGRRETTGNNRRNDRLDLSNTHLTRADLEGADLSEANLYEANLEAANLEGADLSEAKLSGAKNLTAEQVRSAKNWHEADLPDYLDSLKDLPDPPV